LFQPLARVGNLKGGGNYLREGHYFYFTLYFVVYQKRLSYYPYKIFYIALFKKNIQESK